MPCDLAVVVHTSTHAKIRGGRRILLSREGEEVSPPAPPFGSCGTPCSDCDSLHSLHAITDSRSVIYEITVCTANSLLSVVPLMFPLLPVSLAVCRLASSSGRGEHRAVPLVAY